MWKKRSDGCSGGDEDARRNGDWYHGDMRGAMLGDLNGDSNETENGDYMEGRRKFKVRKQLIKFADQEKSLYKTHCRYLNEDSGLKLDRGRKSLGQAGRKAIHREIMNRAGTGPRKATKKQDTHGET